VYNYETTEMLHSHGDTSERMFRRHDVDASEVDPERDWARGSVVFECPCGEKVVVEPVPAATNEAPAAPLG
jgi:hypothetical protein